MTGFKSGASDDDPLGEDEEDDQAAVDDREPAGQADRDRSSLLEGGSQATEPVNESTGGGLPWIYARSSITDGRERTVQLHLLQSTLDREQDARANLDIDETVNKADLREAAYRVGLQNLDDVADQLREWGYDAQ